MKTIIENNITWLIVDREDNFLYDINSNQVAGKKIILAKSITSENAHQFFKEISHKEFEELIKSESYEF